MGSIVGGIGIGLTVAFIVAMLADIFGDRIPGWAYVAMEGCLASGGVAVYKVYQKSCRLYCHVWIVRPCALLVVPQPHRDTTSACSMTAPSCTASTTSIPSTTNPWMV